MTDSTGAIQMRLVVHCDDLEEAIAFYRDAMGLPVELDIVSEGDARVVVLDAGRATLELVNTAQRSLIDKLEVGTDVAREIRVAFQVEDVAASTQVAAHAGALVIAPPTQTPWGSLNARLEGPAGIQLTLFEQVEPE